MGGGDTALLGAGVTPALKQQLPAMCPLLLDILQVGRREDFTRELGRGAFRTRRPGV